MDKYFNWLTALATLIGGGLTYVYGGWDTMLIVLFFCMALDYASGIVKAIVKKKASSDVGRKGIGKKVMIIIFVGGASLVQRIIGDAVPLRELVITFFVANEVLSITENAAAIGLPIPESVKNVLIQLREKADKNEGK